MYLQTAPPKEVDASGAFETCRVEEGRIIHAQAHWIRLNASLKTLGISLRSRKRAQSEWERAASELGEGTIRIAVKRRGDPRWFIHAQPGTPYSRKQILKGAVVRTVPTRWPMGESGPAQAKVSERLSSVLAHLEGAISLEGPVIETLRLGPDGSVTEGTVSNIFMIKDGVLWTPPTWQGILSGVTRTQVIQAARGMKMLVKERPLSRHELFNAEEAFLTNALMSIFPIRQLDGRKIGEQLPGPVTTQLMQKMEKINA